MKKNPFIIVISILILLTSCIFFENIYQPTKSLPNDIVTVSIHSTTEGTDPNTIHSPYFGLCLPIGWIIPGDSVECNGVYNKVIYYNDTLSIAQNAVSPAPAGYYWWVGKGIGVPTVKGNVYADISIRTDNQIGNFSIDYMLGNSHHGVNHQRSNDHEIEIIDDEYSPRGLQASVQGGSVKLNWRPPNNTSGLLGYNIYRDEEKINPIFVIDTIYSDPNPVEGIHHYKVASYYNNGNEHLIPYDKFIVYQSIYISPNGNNANNGSSFTDALQTISYAMSVIRPDSSHPITVFLAPGFYSPFTNEEQFPITCLSHISFIGDGKEATILNADRESSILQFVETNNSSTSGLTVKNGIEGIYVDQSDVSLTNVVIKENSYRGINCISSSLELVNVDLNNNLGDRGGGIYSEESDLYMVNVNIINNTANEGGAIKINKSSLEFIYGNILYNNANNGGGISCNDSSTAHLINSDISYNTADDIGAGIYCTNNSTIELDNVNITNNIADNSGGGLYCIDSSTVDLVSVNIVENIATEFGGGIYCQNNSILYFGEYNHSNIYLNQALIGNDLYSDSLQNIVVDTFSVRYPTDLFAYPINNFTFDIWQGIINQTEEELFVSPQGDNNNSGLTPAEPLKTIHFAFMKIIADSSHHNKINLLDGTYSYSSNEEFFPIIILGYVDVQGTSDSSVIIDAEGNSKAIHIYENMETKVSDITIRGSNNAGIYCESNRASFERLKISNNEGDGFYCNNSSPDLLNITLSENEGIGLNIQNGSSPTFKNGMILNNSDVGIFCNENSNPTIDSILVSGNDGNGIECNNNSNPEITDVMIIGNEGRGVFCLNGSSPILKESVIKNNNNGGVYCKEFSNLTLENCTIESNTAENGSGIFCENSSPSLHRVTIENNSSEKDGGGIACLEFSNAILDSVIMVNNSALLHGGAIYCDNSSPRLERVNVINNSSQSDGGGIYLINNSTPFLNNVILENNSAIRGGGIWCYDNSNFQLVNVIIENNIAENGAGIMSISSDPILQNVVIINNVASHAGGGIYLHKSAPSIVNVTLSNNSAEVLCGGIYCGTYSSAALKNCILWNNSPYELYLNWYSALTVSYSDILGGESGIITNGSVTINWLKGNLDEDPLFIGTGDYPYALSGSSNCIDAGDPDTLYNDPENPNHLGYALYPAMGTIRNDMGAYGGPNAASWYTIPVTTIRDEDTKELKAPTIFSLSQNYPNPFNPSTTIEYSVQERSNVELKLYDILGAQVVVLVNEEQDAGHYKINFNAGRLASGVYLYRLRAGDFVETKKMILMK